MKKKNDTNLGFSLKKQAKMKKKNDTNLGFSLKKEAKMRKKNDTNLGFSLKKKAKMRKKNDTNLGFSLKKEAKMRKKNDTNLGFSLKKEAKMRKRKTPRKKERKKAYESWSLGALLFGLNEFLYTWTHWPQTNNIFINNFKPNNKSSQVKSRSNAQISHYGSSRFCWPQL